MRQIAKKVNITAGSLYHYVSSKEALLFEIQTKFMDELLAKLKEPQPQISSKERLANAVEVLIESIAQNRLVWQVLLDEYIRFPPSYQKTLRLRGDELEELIQKKPCTS